MITVDNGSEFHSHKDIEEATSVEFFFATPHPLMGTRDQ
jgi:transposase, IS30 family